MRVVFFSFMCLLYAAVFSQETCFLELGDSVVTIESEHAGATAKILFINVHENEATSVSALRNVDQAGTYRFVWLHQNGTRRIYFNHAAEVYSVDPNRIFSHEGIVATLAQDSIFSRKAERMAKALAHEILKYVHRADWVISLHNNTPDNYSILSYLPGGSEAANTGNIFVNDSLDPDDFIYTTDAWLFEALKAKRINVILQHAENVVEDGSLSVYCGAHGIPYANVEAEEGHLAEQQALIIAVLSLIESR